MCEMCGRTFTPKSRKSFQRRCSRECYGRWRAEDPQTNAHLRRIATKGRQGWTAASRRSYRKKMSGPGNPAWKGGVTYFRKHGSYASVKYVRCPPEFKAMSRKDGYVMEHRLLVAQEISRPLARQETVHHEDHDPTNNDLSNLMLFESNQAHKLYEAHGSPLPIWSGSSPRTTKASSGA